jgi:hypothetical protein
MSGSRGPERVSILLIPSRRPYPGGRAPGPLAPRPDRTGADRQGALSRGLAALSREAIGIDPRQGLAADAGSRGCRCENGGRWLQADILVEEVLAGQSHAVHFMKEGDEIMLTLQRKVG